MLPLPLAAVQVTVAWLAPTVAETAPGAEGTAQAGRRCWLCERAAAARRSDWLSRRRLAAEERSGSPRRPSTPRVAPCG